MTAQRRHHLIDCWHTPGLVAAYGSGVLASTVVPAWDEAIVWTTMLFTVAWAIVVNRSITAHRQTRCEYCAAQLPDDPGTRARGRARIWLRSAHLVLDPPLRAMRSGSALAIASIAVIVAGPVAAALLILPWPWSLVAAALHFLVFNHAIDQHRRLRPWCPRCGQDDTDDRPEPERLPTGAPL